MMKAVFINVWYLLLTIILLIIIWRIIRLVLKNKDDSNKRIKIRRIFWAKKSAKKIKKAARS